MNHLTLWYVCFWSIAAIAATVIIVYEYRRMRRDKEAQGRRPKPVYDCPTCGGIGSTYESEYLVECQDCGGAGIRRK